MMELKLPTLLKQLKKLSSGLVTTLIALFSLNACNKPPQDNSFRFNLPREVHSLDPLLIRGTAKRFLVFNLNRGLFYYNKESKLTPFGAKKCKWQNSRVLHCSLAKKMWSDGTPVEAKHYVYTYNQILKQKDESSLFTIGVKNIQAPSPSTLVFTLDQKNKDFAHKLTSSYFLPRKEDGLYQTPKGQHFSGPYKLKKLSPSRVELSNNKFFDDQIRPPATGYFVDEPSAALNMYNGGRLDFLRYLETSNIPKYKNTYMTPFARMDGIFLNKEKIKNLTDRSALITSLDYKGLQKIFSSPTKPGCLALPKSFFKRNLPCYNQESEHKKISLDAKSLSLAIPNMPSDDHKKMAQWAQAEWKKNLGLNINIEQLESGVFYESVKKQKLSIYRKSVALPDLSCQSAKEVILDQPEFKGIKVSAKLTCDDFFEAVLKEQIWIPLGMPTFAHLHSRDYSGYYINMLGQFGLEDLRKTGDFKQ